MATIKELIVEAEGYLTRRRQLFDPVQFAEDARASLHDTTFGHHVATELRDWSNNPEPRLGDELIGRALRALRKVKS